MPYLYGAQSPSARDSLEPIAICGMGGYLLKTFFPNRGVVNK